MKKWAALTVILYVLLLAGLTVPVILISFGKWWFPEGSGTTLENAVEIFKEYGYWIWLGLMGLGQAALLVVPVRIAERRSKPRRSLLLSIFTTSFFLANLFLGGVLSFACSFLAEKGFDLFAALGEFAWNDPFRALAAALVLKTAPVVGKSGLDYVFGMFTALSFSWLLWAIIFYLSARKDEPMILVHRTTRWLLRGSILELLVAVPSHIIVRNRHDCCAPFGTFWGIVTGLSVMLLCFGPGVFFLFVERFSRLRPNQSQLSSPQPPKQV